VAHDVFVSYPNVDKATADAVVNALESEGIRCWVAPRDVLHGQDWAAAIVAAIASAKMLVLVFSDGTNQSDHILREVRAAGDAGLAILPFRTTETEPADALKYYIGGTHWLDAMSGSMEQHLDELVATARRIMAGEGQAAAPATPASTRGAWWRRVPAWGWVVSSVAVAALVGGAALVFGGPEGTSAAAEDTLPVTVTEPTAAPSSAPSSEPESSTSTSTTTSSTTIVVQDLEWSIVDDPDLSGTSGIGVIEGLAYDGSQFIAIGHRDAPTVWGSTGGDDWQVLTAGGGIWGPADVVVRDVVAAGPGFVAVGSDRSGDDIDAAVWTSTSGRTWTRQLSSAFDLPFDEEMYAVATDGSLIIAVGSDFDGATSDPAIWLSEDGIAWSRLNFGEPGSDWRQMRTIAVFDGLWIASDGGEQDPTAAMNLWRSTDGLEWARVSTDEVVISVSGSMLVHGMSTDREGFVAVGQNLVPGVRRLGVWVSADGYVWTQVPITSDSGPYDSYMTDVALAGARLLVAVGSEVESVESDGDENWVPRIWIATLDG
jgi:hypothetical protein